MSQLKYKIAMQTDKQIYISVIIYHASQFYIWTILTFTYKLKQSCSWVSKNIFSDIKRKTKVILLGNIYLLWRNYIQEHVFNNLTGNKQQF